MTPIFIALIVIVIVVAVLFSIYNSLVRLRNRTKEAWADIDVQLKRRYNLIPNLVDTVKGYATHEKELLENVTKARNMAMGAQSVQEHGEAENMLTGALKSLFAVSENYPDLKASVNFLELQRELRDTEDKIQAARRFYNANVRDMNIKVETVPSNIIASMFNFKQMELFELKEEEQRAVPKVEF
ncbi:LemA family protein [Candidatus Parcubacteria bacterium]|nr:LemA family protein [Candidatus Parcubacteria bacterium]